MAELQPPDFFHFSSALGWLELGNPAEAGEEIAMISPENLEHPHVLQLRWEVCAAGCRWEAGLAVAETLVRVEPGNPSGHLHRAYALRRIPGGGLQLAWDALHSAAQTFPDLPIIHYNLACYAAQMGRVDEAWELFLHALNVSDNIAHLKRMALEDPDLEKLRTKIQAL